MNVSYIKVPDDLKIELVALTEGKYPIGCFKISDKYNKSFKVYLQSEVDNTYDEYFQWHVDLAEREPEEIMTGIMGPCEIFSDFNKMIKYVRGLLK